MTEERAKQVLDALRETLDLPDDWFQVSQNEDRPGYVVMLALNMTAEDHGDGETGPRVSVYPTRWVEVYGEDGNEDFELYDEANDPDADQWAPPHGCVSILCARGEMMTELLDHLADSDLFKIDRTVKGA